MITIATDCSGIEAPIQALEQLNIPYIQSWSCDIDKFTRRSCDANYKKPEVSYTDMLTRDNSLLPNIDLYICGFPCQSFSTLGRKLGSLDPRAKIIPTMLDTIKCSNPKVCILENVKGFTTIEKGVPMKSLLDELELLGYNVYYSLYNTKDYGLPQNRERVYFICIRKDIQKKSYVKPVGCEMKTFESILVDTSVSPGEMPDMYNKNIHKLKENTKIIKQTNYYSPLEFVSPTLDTMSGQYFIIKQNRKLKIEEALQLQGFSKDFKQVVSTSQLMKQIGNSMSVNVLKCIIKEVLECIMVN